MGPVLPRGLMGTYWKNEKNVELARLFRIPNKFPNKFSGGPILLAIIWEQLFRFNFLGFFFNNNVNIEQ